MSRRGLVDEAIQGILDRVVDGEFPAGSSLPPEADLAALLEVSRPTMREAVRSLSDRGGRQPTGDSAPTRKPDSAWPPKPAQASGRPMATALRA